MDDVGLFASQLTANSISVNSTFHQIQQNTTSLFDVSMKDKQKDRQLESMKSIIVDLKNE